jgi:tRNA(Ile)-lysidine synthase
MSPQNVARAFERALDGLLYLTRAWPGRGLVVAVSGGGDSVALLELTLPAARARDLPVTVAHFDHGLRGAESRDDDEFVRSLAARHDVLFAGEAADVRGFAAARKLSIEDAARQLRRAFLRRVVHERGAHAVLLGHTVDDQAETLLLNLLRGAGPRGLGGMPAAGPRPFLRPLLSLERAELREWLGARGVAWRDDSSNADVRLRRNRLRHDVLPLLAEHFNPHAARALARTAALQREIDDLLRRLAARHLDDTARRSEDGARLTLDRTAFLAEPAALQRAILRAAGERLSPERLTWGGVHVEAVLGGLIKGGETRWVFPSGIVLVRSGNELRLERGNGDEPAETPPPEPVVLRLAPGEEVAFGAGHLRVTRLDVERAGAALRLSAGSREAWFDAETLGDGPFLVRPPARGDRLSLFGSGEHRKLSDLLIDLQVPQEDRRRLPLVARSLGTDGGNEILWAAGVARSAWAPVTAASRRLLLLEWLGPLPRQSRKS